MIVRLSVIVLVAGVFLAISSSGSDASSGNEIVNSSAFTDGNEPDSYPHIAIDSTQAVAVWNHSSDYARIARSTDAGNTWSVELTLDNAVGNDGIGNVDVATDGSGVFVVIWTRVTNFGGDSDIWFARSTDGGLNWSSPSRLLASMVPLDAYDFGPRIAAAPGAWMVAWGASGNKWLTSFSADGLNWADSVQAATAAVGATVNVAISSAGTALLAWSENDTATKSVRSIDYGATWFSTKTLSAGASNWGGAPATDGTGTWLVAFTSNVAIGPGGGDREIAAVRSTDNGVSWSQPYLINTNAGTDGLVIDDSPVIESRGPGLWTAGWHMWNPNMGQFYSLSNDGGLNWSAPLPLVTNFNESGPFDLAVASNTRATISQDLNHDDLYGRVCNISAPDACDDCGGCDTDTDSDTIPNGPDNCRNQPNTNQLDSDSDGVGNVCDKCPNAADATQTDTDFDNMGDVCDDNDDNDGWPDSTDLCPTTATGWEVTSGDSDCDGYPDSVQTGVRATETTIGTQPSVMCAATPLINDEPLPDAWPPDFNDNQLVNGADWLSFNTRFGSSSGGGPPYDVRWDLNASGLINGADMLQLNPFFGKRCDT